MKFFLKPKLALLLLAVAAAHSAQAQDTLKVTLQEAVRIALSENPTIKGEFYQFNLSSCIRQQNSLTAQFVSFSLSNLANIFYPPPIFTIINLCLL